MNNILGRKPKQNLDKTIKKYFKDMDSETIANGFVENFQNIVRDTVHQCDIKLLPEAISDYNANSIVIPPITNKEVEIIL